MATLATQYSCGCGFHTSVEEAAIKHADEQLHTLTILGTVTKPATKPRIQRREVEQLQDE